MAETHTSFPPATKPLPHLRSAGSDAPLHRPGSTSRSGPRPGPSPFLGSRFLIRKTHLQDPPLLTGGRQAPSAGVATSSQNPGPTQVGTGLGSAAALPGKGS